LDGNNKKIRDGKTRQAFRKQRRDPKKKKPQGLAKGLGGRRLKSRGGLEKKKKFGFRGENQIHRKKGPAGCRGGGGRVTPRYKRKGGATKGQWARSGEIKKGPQGKT